MFRVIPALQAAAVAALLFGLHRGWAAGAIGGGFHPGHVWALDQVASMMDGSESWSGWTQRIGAPDPVHLRLIGWAPLLAAAPLSFAMGAAAAMWVSIAVGFVLTARICGVLLERVTGVSEATAAAAALVYAFSPFALGVLANGQLAKMQLWCLPLVLLMADRLLTDGCSLRRSLAVFAAAVAMGFTAPSVGLVAPVALGVWVLVRSPRDRHGAGRAAVSLASVALGLAVPWLVHTVEITGTAGLVPAAPVPGLLHPPALNPVATLGSLVWATGPWDGAHAAINNVAGVGIVALIAAALGWAVSRSRGLLGAGLVGVGGVFALGPSINALGFKWVLPAQAMEWSGYPIVQSGMYYRFSQVAALGLALLVCRLCAAVPRRAVWIAIAVAGLNVAESIREMGTLWPRTLTSIPHAELMQEMAEDPVPGSILELPLSHLDTEGERRLLGQLIHNRATTVLARNMVVVGQPRLERLARLSTDAKGLKQAGFRYVLLHRPGRYPQRLRELEAAFGPSQGSRGLGVWVVP
jgi:hypothetical protein